MKKLIPLILIPAAVAQPIEIPAEIVEQCKKEGCVIVLPEGYVISKEKIDEHIKALQLRAYVEGKNTCKRKDI